MVNVMSREFFLFGHLEIKIDGERSELLNSPKGCALTAYLMLTRKASYPRSDCRLAVGC